MSAMSAAGSGGMGVAGAGVTAMRAKVSAWCGIAFVVLVAVGTFIAPLPPTAGESVDKITNYFADHRAVLLTGVYLQGLSTLPILVFIGALAALIRALEGERGTLAVGVTGAGLITVAIVTAGNAVLLALAFTGRDGDAATTRVLFNLYQAAATLLWFPLVVWVAGASLILLGAAGAFRWIAYLGLLDGVLGLLAAASVAKGGLFALGGIFSLVAFLIFMIWMLAVSITMLRAK